MTRVTPRGWSVLGVGVVAILVGAFSGRSEGAFLGAFCLLMVGGALVAVRLRRPELTATRQLGPMATAGAPFEVRVRLRNTGGITTAPLTVDERLPWPPYGSQPVAVPAIGPGRAVDVTYRITAPRRGEERLGPLESDWSDPFGMVRAHRQIALPETVLVAPPVVPLADSEWATADGGEAPRIARRSTVGSHDDHTTREYRTGDALRRVHWRASARQGELMVRQEEQLRHPQARIVLDTRRSGWRAEPGTPRTEAFEWAVVMVASLGAHLAAAGYRVDVLETATPQLPAPAAHAGLAAHADAFLAGLARLGLRSEHTDDATPWSGAMAPAHAAPSSPGGPVFAVVSRPDAATLDRLARERLVFDRAVAFVVEPPDAELLQRLRADGWQCVSVDRATPQPRAWAAAQAAGVLHADA